MIPASLYLLAFVLRRMRRHGGDRPVLLCFLMFSALPVGFAPPASAAPDAHIPAFKQLLTDPAQMRPDTRQPSLQPLGRELDRFLPRGFFEDRQRLTQTLFDLRMDLNSAIRPTPIEMDLLLDLAALHLTQRMLPEARSFLQQLPAPSAVPVGSGTAWMSPRQTQRALALGAAIDGFDGADRPVPERWPDAPLFVALQHIARADYPAARPLLESAAQIVTGYPAALADPVLPQLLLGAIEGGAWDVARDLAQRLRAEDGNENSPAYLYLLGRAAQLGGDLVAAFDNQAAAAAGTDIWAQRARLALIDIGRSTRTLTPEDARILLTQMRVIWYGGPLGLATLTRLADLELAMRNDLGALTVLADIIRNYPDTDEAAAARMQTQSLIEAIYSRGLAAEIPLADFIAAHRAIARENRADPDFDQFSEAFADYLAASGASALAVSEYADLRASIDARPQPDPAVDIAPAVALPDDSATQSLQGAAETQQDTPSIDPLDIMRDRLRLKQAEALMQGGRWAEAQTVLADHPVTPDMSQRDRYNHMRARLYTALDRPADVLATQMQAPNRDYLRLRAVAAFALEDWEASRTAYEQLFGSQGTEMPVGDQINLLLATHRSGDPVRLRDLLARFPDLAPHWAGLAAGLTAEAPDVLPLRGNAARERVGNADTALRQLQAAGGGQMP